MTRRATGPVPVLIASGVGILTVMALSGCHSLTYDSTATTAPRITTTTVYVPTGSTKELLASIVTSVDGLSEQLVDGNGQRATLARILAEWGAVRPTIEAQRPELLSGFDAVLAQVQRSVDRRRPADADKAAKNLAVLIHSYES